METVLIIIGTQLYDNINNNNNNTNNIMSRVVKHKEWFQEKY